MIKIKKKLKTYEQIIETEKNKTKKAENTIYELRQEIEILKKSYNKNLNYISKLKKTNKNKNIINNKSINTDSRREFNGIQTYYDLNDKNIENNNNEDVFYKNSNDIQFRATDENEKNNNLYNKQNRNYTMPEEIISQTNLSLNCDNNFYDNNIIHNTNTFNKMKGSDINTTSNNKLYSISNANEEAINNLLFN